MDEPDDVDEPGDVDGARAASCATGTVVGVALAWLHAATLTSAAHAPQSAKLNRT
ncbi:MAG TPA: hypothetical protein VJV79_29550 [Polyangiaceae bacterium]|nr:hypothetical protein [Polyangiaceae bacterium]